jgi:phosphate transport system substrate-binding protein
MALSASLAEARTVISGAGATFPFPLYEKWFGEYAKVDPSVAFIYKPVGSGAGVAKLLEGTVDFCASDALPTDNELKGAPGKILHIPTAVGGIAIVYNLPGIPKGLRLTPAIVSEIFLGEITNWNDPRIGRINSGLKLPDQRIIVVHRSDASGTTSIFTDYLSAISGRWRDKVGKGLSVRWPVGTGRAGNGGVTVHVQKTSYAVGYVELAYAIEATLPRAALMNRDGKFTEPDFKTIREAVASSSIGDFANRHVSLVNQPGSNSYPIVGLTWLLFYEKQNDHLKGKKLAEFLEWALTRGQGIAPFMLYAPLPANVAEIARRTVRAIH